MRVYRIKEDLPSELQHALEQTKSDNRTALIVTSLESKLPFEALESLIGQNEKLYLREYELSWRRSIEDRVNISDYYQNVLRQQLVNGQKIILFVDEMPSLERNAEWRELYDPDITHLINSHINPLPLHLWRPQDFRGCPDIAARLGVIDNELPASISDEEKHLVLEERAAALGWEGFQFLLWSKVKLSEDAAHAAGKRAASKIHVDGDAKVHALENAINEELLKGLKKRFEKSLPFQSINLIFVESAAAASYLASINAGGNAEADVSATHE